ncbi:angiopoietin-related protein 1-like [Daktulosphaira vitifoliae]|uniref:angiopoietin-related protein 1-like n=1 Tax=Daktulosphaira vitifoliae TaxID=58002 RepID=UPI0021AAF0A1|nr:angiopoietin-related protein 1-like [Daktulosphaira vitifoliae]
MNVITTLLWAAFMLPILSSGYRTVRTSGPSGPLPVTVHVRATGTLGSAAAANRTFAAATVITPVPIPAASSTMFSMTSSASNQTRNQTRSERLRAREQYLFNVFEVIVSTLETKLQRIENLDKAVEHLMRRVEALDSRVTNNIDKTEAVIGKLRNLDTKLFQKESGTLGHHIESRLTALDKKVGDIDSKLVGLKSQLDNNFLAPVDDINAEASEKKTVNVHQIDVSKLLNAELDAIRANTANIDRKLQYHINVVTDGLGKMMTMMTDVHGAIVEQENVRSGNKTTTTTQAPLEKTNKIDRLVRQMHPILSVSEKMDEVWNVVVGTKSSVDDLVPKSNELLTQTQRQERAISDIHDDLRMNTNKIIANLDVVERRLKKQEDDVVTLAQRPVSPELLRLDPTIDEYGRYDEQLAESTPLSAATVTFTTPSTIGLGPSSGAPPDLQQLVQTARNPPKNRGVVFPSVKNKPPPANISFLTDQFNREVKGYSCLDLLNAGMKQNGVYYLQIRGTAYWYLKVFCEQEIADGGWTVIQRRDDFSEPIRENFNRDWTDYKNGFGDPTKEFWMGNENIYMLTSNDEYMLRIELEDFEGNKRYAQYSHFKIYSEAEYYKLEIDGYEGNAGDSLNDPWYGSNNSPFSTYNRDNDRSSLNCASMLKGGWWWKSCGRGLNGLYLTDPQDLTARQGIVWFRWRGWDYTLKKAQMLIKPKATIISPLPVSNAV